MSTPNRPMVKKEVKVDTPDLEKKVEELEKKLAKVVEYINNQVKVATIGGDPLRSTLTV